jgi:hypothetical protein
MVAQIGIGRKLEFTQSLIMLLNDLLHCWARINVQAKDTVTKTSINNAIKIRPSRNLCWIWSLKVKPKSLPCFLIHTNNECLTVLTVPDIILLTFIMTAIHQVLIVPQTVDPIIVEVDVCWKLDELLSLKEGLIKMFGFYILGIDQSFRILLPRDFNPKV